MQTIPKNVILLSLISFSFASLVGMNFSMETKNGQMSDCPFMAEQKAMCQMNVAEHIMKWRQAFISIQKRNPLAPLAVLPFAILFIAFEKLFWRIKETDASARMRAYKKMRALEIFDPLLLAFSGGILKPKIY